MTECSREYLPEKENTVSHNHSHSLERKQRVFFQPPLPRNMLMPQSILEMAKDLVMAQIAAQNLSPDEMHQALQHTYASLKSLQAQEDTNGSVAVVTPETPPEPVNWRKSITKHTVTCLECGQAFKQLSSRHLMDHGLDGRSYRAKYEIPRTQALAAKEITARRKEMVQRSRPWEKAPTFVKAQAKAQKAVAQQTRKAQRKGTAKVKS
jgi:predicted transcriptional regulator